jgi:hypothetical protein
LGYDRAMRFAAAFALAAFAFVGCSKGKSKLDADRGADVDALWELAPNGTELGIVASPRAVGLGFRAIAALREATNQPDLQLAKPQLDAVLKGMFGSETATPEEAGFAKDRAFAMFVTPDGVLGVMPVGDRNKFMAAKGGTRGSGTADDTLETNTCRPIGTHYVCVSPADMFERIGKGNLRGRLAGVGTRGDAELYMSGLALLGESKGELMLAAVLEPGQVSVFGRWLGTPDGPLASVVGLAAPQPDTKGASGFVALNVAPLLANAPPVPVAGGVTVDQLAKALVGTVTAVIPAGSVDVQLFAPLNDPKPAQTIIDNCKDVGTFFALAEKQTPGACRIVLQGTNALELDAWVDNKMLRLGAKKGPAPAGKPGALTAFGRELSSGTWTAAFWGRGTMLNLTGITPAKEEAPREVAFGIHAMALVNELGVGARVDKDGLRFRALLRTVWANPPDVIDQVVKIAGNDILTGKATDVATKIAAGSPSSAFAADFAAGQGGLMVPAAMIGLASAVVVPAISRMLGGGGDEPETPQMNDADLVSLLLRAYVDEAYPKWKAEHPKEKCPSKIEDVAFYFGDNPGLPLKTDPWGHDLVMSCADGKFVVYSTGPDGKPDTADDIRP